MPVTTEQASHWALLGYSLVMFFFWMGSPLPNLYSPPQPLDPQTIRQTRFKIKKVVYILVLWSPYYAWMASLFLRDDWWFSLASVLKCLFSANIIFIPVFFLYDRRKELKDWDQDIGADEVVSPPLPLSPQREDFCFIYRDGIPCLVASCTT